MEKKYFNSKERFLYVVYKIAEIIVFLPNKVGNWAMDRLNKSYYKDLPNPKDN